jgi:hypothetical protein
MFNVMEYLLQLHSSNTCRKNETSRLCAFNTSNRYNSSDCKIPATKRKPDDSAGYVGKTEMDSHADMVVAGRNCVVMHYTERSCDISPYSDEYAAVKGVPVIQAGTGYTSTNGRSYILIFNETLCMENLAHSLVNRNQLWQYNCDV